MRTATSSAGKKRASPGRRSLRLFASCACVWLLSSGSAYASKSDDAVASAKRSIAEATAGAGSVEQAIASSKSEERSAEARIADGEILFRTKDYARAAGVLNQVIEKYPSHPTAYPDALYLLGETYFESKQYLSARRTYRQLVERGGERGFANYQARGLARLIDVALRTQDYATLDEVFAKISQLPPTSLEGELSYARGKGLFAKKDYAGAKSALAGTTAQSPHFHQARYLLGVIAMKEAAQPPDKEKRSGIVTGAARTRFAAAIEAFRQVTHLPADTTEHRHVIDLSWLAIGRLFYETDQWAQAVEAYNHVDRTSPEFATMLYELAWVYVRVGDADRALRSLEVLAVADPNSPYMADGTLLRADLMLRTGQFEKALTLYQAARTQFDPMREKVETFLASTNDPAFYYDKLSKDPLEGGADASVLPPMALQWAREAEDGPAAFAVIDGVKECRELLKQSNTFLEKMNTILAAPNRVRAFPELKAGEERALSLVNLVSMGRVRLAEGLDAEEDKSVSGEMDRVRSERRAVQQRVAKLPINTVDFATREHEAQRNWNSVSQKLQQLTLQVDQLQATVNGLKRTLSEGPSRGVVRDPASTRQYEAELVQNEADLGIYKGQITELRKLIDVSRMQVGFGDQRFAEDADARAAFRRLVAEETRLAAAGQGGRDATGYAQRITPVLQEAEAADSRLDAALADIEARVNKRAAELRATLDSEVGKLAEYTRTLEGLDSEGRLVVGQVAMRNFQLVRDRLRNIVLRADVGVTEEAWELREEQLTRVRNLQLERSRSEQQLNEELREVLDDMGELEKPPAGQTGSGK
ncbi:MAG TPA: tetratricopeptide repeat protein [Polyangiaceae bacterium]|nr:tetratricopeptide repeat protein [Polyangiaceae bacterium]